MYFGLKNSFSLTVVKFFGKICFVKKVLLKYSQNLLENTCAAVSF